MDYESWEDSDPDPDFRSSTPVFTSDDEYYPTTMPSPNSKAVMASRALMTVPIQRGNFTVNGLLLSANNRVKNFGQRKQRRYENDFVFWNGTPPANLGLNWMTSNPTMMALCAQLDALDLEQKIVRETIFESFKKRSPTLFEAFIDGDDILLIKQQQQKHTPKLMLTDGSSTSAVKRTEREERAEVSYGRIDRKVRQHLARSVEFVQEVESVLLGDVDLPSELEDQARVEQGESQDEWIVYLTLESPFLRMIAHGVAQFYKFPSRSTRDGKSSSAKTVKFNVTRSHQPRRRLSSYLKEHRSNAM